MPESSAQDAAALPTATADVAELRAAVLALQAEALEARDTRIGLEAELKLLRERLRAFEDTPLDEAERIRDEAAAERELATQGLHDVVKAQREEIRRFKASATWRVGRIIVGPASKVMAVVRRR